MINNTKLVTNLKGEYDGQNNLIPSFVAALSRTIGKQAKSPY